MSVSDNREHHYVPKLLLKQFASDQSGRKINLLLTSDGTVRVGVSLKHQARQKGLYKTEATEAALANLEREAACVIRQVASSFSVPRLGTVDYKTIMMFMAMQSHRVPVASNAATQAARELSDRVATARLAKPRNPVDGYNVSVERPMTAEDAVAVGAFSYQMCFDLELRVLRNVTKYPFVLSDHPACLYNTLAHERPGWAGGFGVSSVGVQIFMPLSPECMLVAFDAASYRFGGRRFRPYISVGSSATVASLNALQVLNAESCLFYHDSAKTSYVNSQFENWAIERRTPRFIIDTKIVPHPDNAGSEVLFFHSYPRNIDVGLSILGFKIASDAPAHISQEGLISVRDTKRDQENSDFFLRAYDGTLPQEDFLTWLSTIPSSWHEIPFIQGIKHRLGL